MCRRIGGLGSSKVGGQACVIVVIGGVGYWGIGLTGANY
jgi:hypothetical protein